MTPETPHIQVTNGCAVLINVKNKVDELLSWYSKGVVNTHSSPSLLLPAAVGKTHIL